MYGYLNTPSTTCFIASSGSFLSLHSSTSFRETTKAYYTTARGRRFEMEIVFCNIKLSQNFLALVDTNIYI